MFEKKKLVESSAVQQHQVSPVGCLAETPISSMLLVQQPVALVSGGGLAEYHHSLQQQQQHHQVSLEVVGSSSSGSNNYNTTPTAYNSDSTQHHDATSLYYQPPHGLVDATNSNSSYSNLITPCDYNTGQPYCPPHAQSEYSGYQQTTNSSQHVHYASAVLPSEAPSSGYYNQQQHYSSCCPPQQQQSADGMTVPSTYDCYSTPQQTDHLEVKYQAAFVDAMESNNSSMDTSVAGSSSDLSAVDPLVLHHHQHQQQQTQGNEFHYEYETNYGNNEWTMTSNYSYPTESYSTASVADPTGGIRPSVDAQLNDVNMDNLPNYCFAACVFSSSSSSTTPPLSSSATEQEPVEMVLASTYSSSPHHVAGASVMRHFESYDYATLADELHPAL